MNQPFSLSPVILAGMAGFLLYTGLVRQVSWIRIGLSIVAAIVSWLLIVLFFSATLAFSTHLEPSTALTIAAPTIAATLVAALWMLLRLRGKRRWVAVGATIIFSATLLLAAPFLTWQNSLNQARKLSSLQASLDHNQELWKANKPLNYRFVVSVACYCDGRDPYVNTVSVSVVGETATFETVPKFPGEFENYRTVEMLFQVVQGAIDASNENVTVIYDPRLGYPTQIMLNSGILSLDAAKTIKISGFEAVK